jgi:hypothetical protein
MRQRRPSHETFVLLLYLLPVPDVRDVHSQVDFPLHDSCPTSNHNPMKQRLIYG